MRFEDTDEYSGDQLLFVGWMRRLTRSGRSLEMRPIGGVKGLGFFLRKNGRLWSQILMSLLSYLYYKFMSAPPTLGHMFDLVVTQNCFKEPKGNSVGRTK